MRTFVQLPSGAPAKRALAKLGFLALCFAALFNLGAFWIAETSYVRIRGTLSAVVDTEQVLTGIERVRVDLLAAESTQRRFVVTGDAGVLRPYEMAAGSLDAGVAALKSQMSGNRVHMSLLTALQRDTKSLLLALGKEIELRKSAGLDAAIDAAVTQSSRILIDTMRLTIDGMRQEEQRVRNESLGALRTDLIAIRLGVFAMALLNLLLVTFGVVFLWREIQRQTRARALLAERGKQLSEEVEARTAQLRELSRFLENVREEEKKRVARELHDDLGGTLAAAKIDLQMIGDRVRSDAAIAARLQRVNAALDDAIAVKRRIIEDLRPTLLDNLGIGAALRWQCEQFTKRSGNPCDISLAEPDLQLSPELSIAVYRIVQEALTNVTKYANAKRVVVGLVRDGARWHLRIHDDGVGLDLARQHHPTSHGLISIRERVRALGGELRISGGPGRGTTIEAWFSAQTATAPSQAAGDAAAMSARSIRGVIRPRGRPSRPTSRLHRCPLCRILRSGPIQTKWSTR